MCSFYVIIAISPFRFDFRHHQHEAEVFTNTSKSSCRLVSFYFNSDELTPSLLYSCLIALFFFSFCGCCCFNMFKAKTNTHTRAHTIISNSCFCLQITSISHTTISYYSRKSAHNDDFDIFIFILVHCFLSVKNQIYQKIN